MAGRERPVDRALGRIVRALIALGTEARAARLDRGLSIATVAKAAGCSASEVSRFERGLLPNIAITRVARVLAAVGLDVSLRAYAGGQPVRDAGQLALLARFRARLHRSLSWATEVPLPIPGDQRAWDAVVGGSRWRFGIEAETTPRDVQALARRLHLKQRDAKLEGIVLVLPATRHTRAFLREAEAVLQPAFPVPGARALELLGAGVAPPGNCIIVL